MKKFQPPKLPSPKLKAPRINGPKIQAPKVMEDLMSDMRERHLLLPALLLIVALIAVPIGLKTSSAPPPPTLTTAAGESGTSAIEPAVLTEQVGIRSYRKRLAALKQKNPFQRHFALPSARQPNPGKLAPPSPQSSAPPSSPSSLGSTPTTSSPSSGTPVSIPTTTSSPTPTARTVTVTTTTPASTHHRPASLYTHVIDVQVGPLHERRTIKSVNSLTMLPGDQHPVVLYLGSAIDSNVATFSVSSDVDSVNGDGSCTPSAASCQYLTMKPGQTETFDYAPEGRVYSMTLQGIRTVAVPRNRHTAHLKGSDAPVFPGAQK